jgi:rfaE bifunctional protein nucleotidyltransferase chain/domain
MSHDSATWRRKLILDPSELDSLVERLKGEGKRIVFTNGVFDLLHVGHIRCLRDARALGDVLLVALNSDVSTRGNKGPGLPIIPEMERAEVLAALECVDYITLFSDPMVDHLLMRLQPHVHAKGSDYTRETVPERDAVLSYGGEIAITGDPKHHATRDIIRRIQDLGGEKPGAPDPGRRSGDTGG